MQSSMLEEWWGGAGLFSERVVVGVPGCSRFNAAHTSGTCVESMSQAVCQHDLTSETFVPLLRWVPPPASCVCACVCVCGGGGSMQKLANEQSLVEADLRPVQGQSEPHVARVQPGPPTTLTMDAL